MINKPTYEELEQRNQLTPTLWRMFILICIVGLIMTGIVGYGFLTGDRINKVYAPLVDAVMEIKLEATTAHLWLEEILSGDRDEDIGVVWKHQDQAEWYAKAMLEGGTNPEGTFIPLDDAELRSKIKIVQRKLAEFRKISQQRIETESISGIGTDIDQQFDDLFHSLLKEADEVETRLQQVMMKDLRSFRFTHVFLITACILLFLIFGIVFWRFDRQRAMNLLLNEANKALEKEIAEHKRAKEALQESEARVQLVLQNMPVMLDAFDEKGHIIVWNLECERVTGNSADEIIGNPNATQLLYPDEDYRTYLKEQLTRCGGKFRNLEWDISCKDGSKKTILWSNISEQFPIPGWHSWTIGLDITERKRAEEELKRYSERLEEMVEERTRDLQDAQEKLLRRERLAVLGQLAGGVGHELRNPLGVINNAVYYLKTVHEGADEKTQECLEMISSEVRIAEKIVADLMSLSRTKPTEAERTAVSDLISGALERASVAENIEVEVDVPEGLPEVFIDRQQIKQVLLNLITNACQAMAEGGGLSVRARAVGERVEVAVSDTGCGIIGGEHGKDL